MTIARLECGHYRIPLPVVLSDSTHGDITHFEIVTVRLAEAWNLPVTSHGAHDITVHLLAAVPNRSYLEVHGFGLDRYIAAPLAIEQGMAVASERPGHGLEFDWKGLEALRA